MPALPRLAKWVRISIGVGALVFGVLQIAAGLWGPEPVRFEFSRTKYYQILAAPSENFWLWGLLGFAVAAVLLARPWRSRGGR